MSKPTAMSDHGRHLLEAREGVRLKAYRDVVGVWTIGVGHTAAAGAPAPKVGMTITAEEADAIFRRDLVQYEQAVSSAVSVPLSQGQYDALVSLTFNIGVGAFKKSTVLRRLNAGDYAGAAQAFMMWRKPPQIIGRRQGEMNQFLRG